MQTRNYKSKFIVSLSDTSDNVITDSLCMDGFACHQFLLVDKPGYTIAQEVCETEFSAGDVIYAAAGKFFGIRCDGEMRIRYIAFTGKQLRPLLHYCNFGEFRVISPPKENNIYSCFDEILHPRNTADNDAELSTSLYSLIGYLGAARIESDNYIYDKQSMLIKPIVDYMQKDYRNPDISFSELLSFLGISRDEADRLFLDTFSMTTIDYYKLLRMENAKHLLFFYYRAGINYVAANMGYKNTTDFCSDFYDVFKMSPDEFIALYHKGSTS